MLTYAKELEEELTSWNPEMVNKTIAEMLAATNEAGDGPLVDPNAAEFRQYLATLEQDMPYARAVFQFNEGKSDRWCANCGECESQIKRIYDEAPATHPEDAAYTFDFTYHGRAWYVKGDDDRVLTLGFKDVPYLQSATHCCGADTRWEGA